LWLLPQKGLPMFNRSGVVITIINSMTHSISGFLRRQKSAPAAGGWGASRAAGAGLDFGVTPDQDAAILRIRVGWSLCNFAHPGAIGSGSAGTWSRPNQSGGMAVELAGFGDILCLLRRHFRGILTARHTARPECSAGDLVLG
jgi:hypothetical protein